MHREIICQSWPLLTPFYSGPIVHCADDVNDGHNEPRGTKGAKEAKDTRVKKLKDAVGQNTTLHLPIFNFLI